MALEPPTPTSLHEQAPQLGSLAIHKSDGSTPSEKELARLAERTFLGLWSYPNLWRAPGKELCDLLVVFGEHVIVFSDKNIVYQGTPDPLVAWRRWYTRSIAESAAQIRRAEQWIRNFPEKLFLDSQCQKRFPVSLPAPEKMVVHRIVVARGAATACRAHFGGGSGSLLVVPGIVGDQHLIQGDPYEGQEHLRGVLPPPFQPFMVGQVDPALGYVHVLDDTSLGIIMETLDTVRDFVDYLDAKERFILGGHLVSATGEEDLLAYYLRDVGKNNFVLPTGATAVAVDDSFWAGFQKHPQRIAQIVANRPSYLWDELCQRFCTHTLHDDQHYATERGVGPMEPAIRFLARESRTRRRMLAQAILGVVARTETRKNLLEARVVEPSEEGDPLYVFLALRRPPDVSYDEYRKERRAFLEAYVRIARSLRPSVSDVVGIAFNTRDSEEGGGSEDLLYLDGHGWTPEAQKEAEDLQRDTGILVKTRALRGIEKTYPDIPDHPSRFRERMKGHDRNKLCFCGSGLKLKRCHGR